MPITIANPVVNPLPNQLTRIRLERWPIDHGSAYSIPLFVLHPASGRGIEATMVVRDGRCTVLRKNAAPVRWEDLIIVHAAESSEGVVVANGYAQIEAILAGGGNRNAKFDAILTALLAMGVIHAELGGVVS